MLLGGVKVQLGWCSTGVAFWVQVDSAMFTRACIISYIEYRSSDLCLIGKLNVAMVHCALGNASESLSATRDELGFLVDLQDDSNPRLRVKAVV